MKNSYLNPSEYSQVAERDVKVNDSLRLETIM